MHRITCFLDIVVVYYNTCFLEYFPFESYGKGKGHKEGILLLGWAVFSSQDYTAAEGRSVNRKNRFPLQIEEFLTHMFL